MQIKDKIIIQLDLDNKDYNHYNLENFIKHFKINLIEDLRKIYLNHFNKNYGTYSFYNVFVIKNVYYDRNEKINLELSFNFSKLFKDFKNIDLMNFEKVKIKNFIDKVIKILEFYKVNLNQNITFNLKSDLDIDFNLTLSLSFKEFMNIFLIDNINKRTGINYILEFKDLSIRNVEPIINNKGNVIIENIREDIKILNDKLEYDYCNSKIKREFTLVIDKKRFIIIHSLLGKKLNEKVDFHNIFIILEENKSKGYKYDDKIIFNLSKINNKIFKKIKYVSYSSNLEIDLNENDLNIKDINDFIKSLLITRIENKKFYLNKTNIGKIIEKINLFRILI